MRDFSRALFFLIRSLFAKCFSTRPGGRFCGCSSGSFVSETGVRSHIFHVPSLFSSILTTASIIILTHQMRISVVTFLTIHKVMALTFTNHYFVTTPTLSGFKIYIHLQSSQRMTFDSTPPTITSSDFSGLLCVGHMISGVESFGL